MGHQPKLGSYGKNWIFGQKPKSRAQKKPTLLGANKVDMLPVNQVAALMNEAREENLALRMQVRGSRPEIQPSAPEDRYKVV